MKENHKHNNGLGLLGVVQIVFIILKLLHMIDWPWMIVLIPLWIDIVICIFAIVSLCIVMRSVKDKDGN